jgi:thiamine kinase-like enzyme
MPCRVMMMRVMTIKKRGGDDYFNRLLSYFREQFKEKIVKMVKIREAVFLIRTEKNKYIVKGYSSNRKLVLQETFTATLRNEGFTKSYIYLQAPYKEPLFFEGKYFGCIEYIKPNEKSFSYRTYKNRAEGLELLEEFHHSTAAIEPRYRTLISTSDIQAKWTERSNIFSNNTSLIRYFLKDPFIDEMLDWSNWSLDGMKENCELFLKEPHVILHGDVAHHNFLRDSKGGLNLIDFDLISIGPECLDILQFANRILPHIDWSFEFLAHHKQIHKYLNERAFLYALAFPADIFREWNRMVREKALSDPYKYNQVVELTLGQFYLRRQFVKKLKKHMDSKKV